MLRSALVGLASIAIASVGAAPVAVAAPGAVQVPGGQVSVFTSGLENPRGLAFSPDGKLFVAEGGTGGTRTTVGKCQQVPSPVGPYSGGFTSRISEISDTGGRSTVVDHLPSSSTGPGLGRLTSGVADIAFLGGQMYAITAGSGCSHGLKGTHNAVLRITGHSAHEVANLSLFQKTHPVAHPNPSDFEPDGTWYSMVAFHGALYAVEPNHGEVDRITPGGAINRVVDVSAQPEFAHLPEPGHIVPTSLAVGDGRLFLSNLGTFPIVPGSQILATVNGHGKFEVKRSGLTAVVGLTFDKHGHLFALETSTAVGGPTPGNGKVVEVTRTGLRTVVSGLTFPTGMTFGPDGALYVSNFGFGSPSGGQVLRICLPHDLR